MGIAYALTVHSGQLFAGGIFGPGSAPPYTGMLRWNDPQWTPAGSGGPSDEVWALTTYRGKLIAGGYFNSFCCGNPPPPEPGERIAMFDGTSWLPLGSGMNGSVSALTTFDPDGSGPAPELLIAGGLFTFAGGQPASHIAAWDGAQWSPLGQGVNGEVESLCVFNNQLYVGGFFSAAGGQASSYLAVYGCPLPPCYANCDQSTASPILNINDFMCFINTFAVGNAAANCDASTAPPTLNILDFSCFINRFAAGCS